MPDQTLQSHTFGGGATTSVMPPWVLAYLVLLILIMIFAPRRYVVVAYLFGAFTIWLGAQLYLGGLHWLAIRLLTIAGIIRALISRPAQTTPRSRFGGGVSKIDWAFFVSAAAQVICVLIQYHNTEALVNQLGFTLDMFGGYFVVRCFIRDESEIFTAIKCLAVLSLMLGLGMIIERVKLTNVFALFAGLSLPPAIRDGRIRAQGVFQHALMAGSVGATWIPLFLLLWRNGKAKLLAVCGLFGATVMTWTSQSSTPLLAYAAGLLAIACWPLRKKMKLIRRAIVLAIVGLALVMKAPVWFIIARIDLTGGSSGYHRAEIVDQFIRHFWDWWLIGVKDTSSWGWDLWDVQNQYVSVGEGGGLLAFCLFIWMVSRCYAQIGDARSAAGDKKLETTLWLVAAALFSNTLAFIGVDYFDQSKVSWFLIVAIVCALTNAYQKTSRAVVEPAPSRVLSPLSNAAAARSSTRPFPLPAAKRSSPQ